MPEVFPPADDIVEALREDLRQKKLVADSARLNRSRKRRRKPDLSWQARADDPATQPGPVRRYWIAETALPAQVSEVGTAPTSLPEALSLSAQVGMLEERCAQLARRVAELERIERVLHEMKALLDSFFGTLSDTRTEPKPQRLRYKATVRHASHPMAGRVRTAWKDYTCSECGATIRAGDLYAHFNTSKPNKRYCLAHVQAVHAEPDGSAQQE